MERTLKAVHGSLNVTVPHELAQALGWHKGQRLRFERRNRGLYMEASVPRPTHVLVTIGYEGHSPESFVQSLRKHAVELLVDVRDLPLSRRRGFSKSSLASFLEAQGIEYRHLKPLGAPKRVRDPYKRGGSGAAFRSAYLAHLSGQAVSLESLKWAASRRRVAIMCVESNHQKCHRDLLAADLQRDGFAVVHA